MKDIIKKIMEINEIERLDSFFDFAGHVNL